jgi:hypothetical protein
MRAIIGFVAVRMEHILTLIHLIRVQIQKKVISDLKSENQFLSKQIFWDSIRQIFPDFMAHGILLSIPFQNLDPVYLTHDCSLGIGER